ncbi:MAG: TVP38/TMEM64 family protein [Parcubacteria group bacterium]|nr:TVP38/TMEM64 family protein [Parcubacteria group bacterium]
MPWFRARYIRSHKLKLAICFWAFAFFVWLLFYVGASFQSVLGSPEAARAWVLGFGRAAPLAFFVLQVLQVVVAPLNDFVINVTGGFLFGPWLGFAINYTGWILGAVVVFFLARRVGIPFVRLFIREDKIERYNRIVAQGQYLIFVLFLLPGPPDDLLVYVAGLSRSFKFRTFLWMIVVSKVPGKLVTSFIGSDVAGLDVSAFSVFLYALFVVGSLLVVARHRSELRQLWPRTKGNPINLSK